MRAKRRPWRATAVLLVAAETAALFWAYFVLDLGHSIPNLGQSPLTEEIVANVVGAIRDLVPVWLSSSLLGFASLVGLGWLSRTVLGTGSALAFNGNPSLGGAVVAPVYFVVRRVLRPLRRQPVSDAQRGLHGRTRPSRTMGIEPPAPASVSARAAA